jgi:hypothetical protein
VQFDGFDVTDAQFPPSEWLPSNVRLETWNVLEPVPEHLVGQYDVVNIRYFALVVRKENLSNLLKNLISLLSKFRIDHTNFSKPLINSFRAQWISPMDRNQHCGAGNYSCPARYIHGSHLVI